MKQIAQKVPMINKAITVEETFMKMDEERLMYEMREKGRNDYINRMRNATEEGIAKGLKQGLEQGKKQGLEQVALKMIAENIPLEQIAKITGLSIKEIKKIKK